MKHAYLIMAHEQFEVLKLLVASLDDPRNDIYIHFDRKVKHVPSLSTRNSRLFVLEDRVRVIWGDVSQIKAEYALFKAAYSEGEYGYYHLISGIHFPLKSQDEIHSYFDTVQGKCVMRCESLSQEEIDMRFGYYHFFLKHLIDRRRWVNKLYHLGWRFMLSVQKRMGIRRDTSFVHGKASQWCSLTEDAVGLLLNFEKDSLKNFSRSFCSDEFFVRSVIDGKVDICDDDRICYVEFVNTTPKKFSLADYGILMDSGAFFARKFSDRNIDLCEKIINTIKTRQ